MIYNLELVSFKNGDEHNWTGAKEELNSEEKVNMERLERLLQTAPKAEGEPAASESISASAAEPEASASALNGSEVTTEAAEQESAGELPSLFLHLLVYTS